MEEKVTIKTNNTLPITIEIPFEEYKELLIIKGKYEELKSQKDKQTLDWVSTPHIREPLPETPYKITCREQ